MSSDRKIDYSKLVQHAGSTLKLKTPESVRQSLINENPGIDFPQFSKFFIADKNVVPKGAKIFKDLLYMERTYDLHFVSKSGFDHVLYLVK